VSKRLTTAESIGKNPSEIIAVPDTAVVRSYVPGRPVTFPFHLEVESIPGVEITIATNCPVDLLPGNSQTLIPTLTKHLHRSLTGSVLYLSTNRKQNLLSATLWTWENIPKEIDVDARKRN